MDLFVDYFLNVSSGSLTKAELVHTIVAIVLSAKKSISKAFFSTAFLNFCAISGCVHEAITMQLIDGHHLVSVRG